MEGLELLDQSIRRAKMARMAPQIVHQITPFAEHVERLEGAITALSRRLDSLETTNDNLANRIKFLDKLLNPQVDADDAPSKVTITVEHIINRTAFHFGVSPNEVKGQRRDTKIITPRQVAMYLAKKLTFKSMPRIGLHFEGRDHSTVFHAVKKITSRLIIDPLLADAVAAIERVILSTAPPAPDAAE